MFRSVSAKAAFKGIAVATGILVSLATGSAQATTIIYTGGHTVNTTAVTLGGVTLAAGMGAGGFGTSDASITAAIGDGSTGSFGAYDALVIGENLGSISAAGKTAIFDFTNAGGHTVVLGSHGSEVAFLNGVFGLSVTGAGGCSYCDDPISRVAGTGPATLKGLNGSWFVNGAPSTVLYTRDYDGATAAFVTTIGSGTLSWLAWDFCECGDVDSDEADWYSVLGEAAITEDGGDIPEPGTLALFGLGLAGLGFVRRRRAA